MQKLIGILGGTFDPIHNGHLAIAHAALEKLQLDHIEFIPCFLPPHRTKPLATPAQRLAMLELAVKINPRFIINPIEMQLKNISYTVDTLKMLKENNPDVIYYYIIGADAFLKFNTWKNPEEILTLAKLVVINRDEIDIDTADYSGEIILLPIEPIYISATEIRHKIKQGEKNIHGLPKDVEKYIIDNGLYIENTPF